MKQHNTDPYLLSPTHRITVNLIGCGGTGSQMLNGLYRMHEALLGIGHAGLLVTAWDADHVTEANIGRQLFSAADVAYNKADVLITRINRFGALDWISRRENYNSVTASKDENRANITISCVDTVKARLEIVKMLKYREHGEPNFTELYWLDMGNSLNTGQCVLGTVNRNLSAVEEDEDVDIERVRRVAKKKTAATKVARNEHHLPNVFDVFPGLAKVKDKDTGPSCSLAQALNRQDLYINSTLAQFGLTLLWKLFREGRLKYHGCYVNLDTMSVNPIKVPQEIS